MSLPSDSELEQVQQMARLRSAGKSWTMIAEELELPEATVTALRQQHAGLWPHYQVEALRDLLYESTAEAIHTLRKMLRSEEPRWQQEASSLLLKIHIDFAKTHPAATLAEPQTHFEIHQVTRFLETLPDERLRNLVQQLRTHEEPLRSLGVIAETTGCHSS